MLRLTLRYYLIVHGLLCFAGCGSQLAPTATSLLSHVPPGFADLPRLARMDPSQKMTLDVALPLRDRDVLDALIADQADPTAPSYHAYLQPAEFSRRFHPTPEEFAAVTQTLRSAGFDVEDAPHGTLLRVSARVGDVEDFFETRMYNYDDADAPAFAPVTEIHIPENLHITSVTGLSRKAYHRASPMAGNLAPNATPLSPTDVRNAYDFPTGVASAKGQSLTLVELEGYLPQDVASYDAAFNLPAAPLYNVNLNNAPPIGSAGEVEAAVDIEMVQILAPDISQIMIYQAPNVVITALLNELANPTLVAAPPRVMSYSWELCEKYSAPSDYAAQGDLYAQMAAQGQTFLAASGDSGAKCDGTDQGVASPASQPYVMSVGGTVINMSGTQVTGETAWLGSGGGISTYSKSPPWQPAAITPASLGSTTMRTLPDVSLNSPGYACFINSDQSNSCYGTSFATPLWAAALVLANSQRAIKNLPPLGFVPPMLYQIANSADYATVFKDIADGSDNGTYPAVKGYDAVTGLGVIRGAPMLALLSRGYPHVIMQTPILQE